MASHSADVTSASARHISRLSSKLWFAVLFMLGSPLPYASKLMVTSEQKTKRIRNVYWAITSVAASFIKKPSLDADRL